MTIGLAYCLSAIIIKNGQATNLVFRAPYDLEMSSSTYCNMFPPRNWRDYAAQWICMTFLCSSLKTLHRCLLKRIFQYFWFNKNDVLATWSRYWNKVAYKQGCFSKRHLKFKRPKQCFETTCVKTNKIPSTGHVISDKYQMLLDYSLWNHSDTLW